jgi:hypothetical protein
MRRNVTLYLRREFQEMDSVLQEHMGTSYRPYQSLGLSIHQRNADQKMPHAFAIP